MFDVGSGEVVVIAAVAIIVLGPETCIKGAQKLGRTLRMIQTEWALAKRHFETADVNELTHKIASQQKSTFSDTSSLKPDINHVQSSETTKETEHESKDRS